MFKRLITNFAMFLLGLTLCWSCGVVVSQAQLATPQEFRFTQDAEVLLIHSPNNVIVRVDNYIIQIKKISGRYYVTAYSWVISGRFYRYAYDWDAKRYKLVEITLVPTTR